MPGALRFGIVARWAWKRTPFAARMVSAVSSLRAQW